MLRKVLNVSYNALTLYPRGTLYTITNCSFEQDKGENGFRGPRERGMRAMQRKTQNTSEKKKYKEESTYNQTHMTTDEHSNC